MKKNLLTKIRNRKGFTLAELLIVVAIIGVLVAISIPIFTSQLEKAREATDEANLRAAYAAGVAEVLDNEPSTDTTWVYTTDAKLAASGTAITGKASQDGFQGPNPGLGWTTYTGEAKDNSLKVTYTASTKTITVNFE